MIRYFMFFCVYLLCLSVFGQGENQIKLRYWNGATDGKGITNPVGLQVSASYVPVANALVRVDEATLSGDAPKFYFKKKFVLFFTVQNVSSNDVAIYDWAFKAVCPVDNMGRKFDANSIVPLTTPYIPDNIYIVLKPGEKKQFYSSETDFYWCLPQNKDDLPLDPQFFQGLITCASITGAAIAAKPNQQPGVFQPPTAAPQKPDNNLDPQLDRMIKDHNDLIQQNENEKAEILKARILNITNAAYPAQVDLVASKLMKPQVITPTSSTASSTLSFNGNSMEAEGDCMGATATLTSNDESTLLILNNIGGNGNYSVNQNFYTNGCLECLAIQVQDINTSQTFIAVSGTVNVSEQAITIDVTVKELISVVEGGGSSYRLTGKIICEY